MNLKRMIIVMLMCTLLVGCSNKDQEKMKERKALEEALMIDSALLPPLSEREWQRELDETESEGKYVESKSYEKVEWDLTKLLGTKASLQGILCREKDILVLDSKNDQLLVLDYDGKIIRSLGKTGIGTLEFSRPTAITMENDNIYIVDGNNDRIQILDQELTFKEELKIERQETNPDFVFKSIAIDQNETIYLSGETEERPGILFYRKNEKEGHWIPEYFNGFLAEKEGVVYAINSVQAFHKDGDKRKIPIGSGSGRNYLFKITDDKLSMERELPFGEQVLDFCFRDDKIVYVSNKFQKLSEIGQKDNNIQFLGSLEIDWLTGYLSLCKEGNIYVTDGTTGVVHTFLRKEY